MKKIVIKMRSYKKLINQDLLQLALIISLLKVDPDSYLGLRQPYGYDSGGGVMLGEAFRPTPIFPSSPLKDPSTLLERYQEDIIEELNTLGSFNRFSLYGDIPVQLSAYLVDTDHPCMDADHHTDSDSGISDTEHVGSPCSVESDQPGSPADRPQSPEDLAAVKDYQQPVEDEGTSNDDGDMTKLWEQSDVSTFVGRRTSLDGGIAEIINRMDESLLEGVERTLLGGGDAFRAEDGLVGGAEAEFEEFHDFYDQEMMDLEDGAEIPYAEVPYGPEIPPELAQAGIPDIEDHGAIQYELLHMDEQLMNLDYNIEDLDEAFIKMDEEIAKTISEGEDDLMERDPELEAFDEMFNRPNPFDVWEREAYSAIPDLLQIDSPLTEPLLEEGVEPVLDLDQLGELGTLDEFNLDMLESPPQDQDLLTEDEILRNDVMFSRSRDTGDLTVREVDAAIPGVTEDPFHTQVFTPETLIRGKSAEENDPLDQALDEALDEAISSTTDVTPEVKVEEKEKVKVKVEDEKEKEEVNEDIEVMQQEDLMAMVLKESGIPDGEIKIVEPEPERMKTEEIKVEDIKVEDDEDEEVLHEELLDVVSSEQFQSSLEQSGGACAQVDLGSLYGRPGKGVPDFTLSYQPFFNWDGFQNDHASYVGTKLEPGVIKLEPGVGRMRRRDESESSSGYYSSDDIRSTRDERLAAKLGLPYTVRELINSPVDRFNEMLNNPVLTQHQIKICKDIRRRGKNKVAAQNCRKRKLETIEELQQQVQSVRRRKEQLVREREQLEQERRRWSSKLVRMEQFVMAGMGKDVAEFTLQVVDDRVELTARVGGGSSRSSRSRQ